MNPHASKEPAPLIVRSFRHRAVVVTSVIAAGGLLFYCVYRARHDFATTGGLHGLAHAASLFVRCSLGFIAAVLVVRDVHAWSWTIRSLGWPSIRLCRRVYGLSERARFKTAGGRAMLVSGLAITAVLLAAWVFTRFELLLWIIGFRFVFMLHEPVDNARPPAVLVLGASQRAVFRLQSEIEMAARLNRVVSLLDLSAMPLPEDLAHEIHEWDVFRVPDHAQWESMVHALEAIAPIVVLDHRVPSPHVARELQFMLEPGRVHKLIVVVAEGEQRRVAAGIPALSPTRVCAPAKAQALVHEMTRLRRSLPRGTGVLGRS